MHDTRRLSPRTANDTRVKNTLFRLAPCTFPAPKQWHGAAAWNSMQTPAVVRRKAIKKRAVVAVEMGAAGGQQSLQIRKKVCMAERGAGWRKPK
eukprot:1155833-Pelagomonas_calceolata.AAC.5